MCSLTINLHQYTPPRTDPYILVVVIESSSRCHGKIKMKGSSEVMRRPAMNIKRMSNAAAYRASSFFFASLVSCCCVAPPMMHTDEASLDLASDIGLNAIDKTHEGDLLRHLPETVLTTNISEFLMQTKMIKMILHYVGNIVRG